MSVGEPTLLRIELAVARVLSGGSEPADTYEAVLAAIGESLGWELGAAWEVDGERLRCAQTWRRGEETAEFEAFSRHLTLDLGEGLPGRVWEHGEPSWIVDTPADANFPRAEAARRAGLHAAFCFPVLGPDGTLGAIELFSRDPREPDAELLASMAVIGSQIGQFVARRRAEAEVHASESRLRAMLEAALDAVITMDHRGVVLGWNAAAEAIFGYAAGEATGRELADLVVPHSLREQHRHGLARFLETEEAVVLDRRLELTGMRKGGDEFPVELTITRIALPGPPVFTGYVRDITERKQAEAELRASRQRLVEAAVEERRRIERNLHDGAQQHLVGIALMLRNTRAVLEVQPAEARGQLEAASRELATALDELRELASGIHPAILTERGLAPALATLADRSAVPARVDTDLPDRLPARVEAGVYYTVAEALANAGKHAQAGRVEITVRAPGDGIVVVEVSDDGIGGASDRVGSGLSGLRDRVEALGGTFSLDSPAHGGTRVAAEIPTG
jgi:PAS domain S-box-containing protein